MFQRIKRACGISETGQLTFHCTLKPDYDKELDVVGRAIRLNLKVEAVCLDWSPTERSYCVTSELKLARELGERVMIKLVRLVGVEDCVTQLPWNTWVAQYKGESLNAACSME